MPVTKLMPRQRRHQHQEAAWAPATDGGSARRGRRPAPLAFAPCFPVMSAILPMLIERARSPDAQSRPTGTHARPPGKRARGRRRRKPRRSASRRSSARFAAANPEPKGELEYVNPFTLLVAVVLSAQATDAGVNKATRGLFKVADTPKKMVALGVDGVQERIKTIGLYRNKAKNVIALSRAAAGRARRRGAARARGAGGLAGRRPQDRQCGAQHRLRRADAGGRHPRVSRGAPARSRLPARRRWRWSWACSR